MPLKSLKVKKKFGLVPQYLDIKYVLMLILTYFGAYDMDKLMSTPFCHIMYLV